MRQPETQYVDVGGTTVAYQVFGAGEVTVLFLTSWATSLEGIWSIELFADYADVMAARVRMIMLDQRGTGVSDRGVLATSVEESLADVLAVLDAVGVERAVIQAQDFTAPAALAFAARYPERTQALVLLGPTACIVADEGYPIGLPREALEPATAAAIAGWGQAESTWNRIAMPGAGLERIRQQAASIQRQAVAPRDVPQLVRMCMSLDAREYLPQVRAPILVVHQGGDRFIPPSHGRWIADHALDGHYVELPGDIHYVWWDVPGLLGAMVQILPLDAPAAGTQLAVIVVTDIVESTEQASRLGPQRWRRLLGQHDEALRRRMAQRGGTEHGTAGDSFLATFPSAANAVAFGLDAARDAVGLGLRLRAGVHAGEVSELNGSIHGIAIHIATRVQASAPAGAVVVSTGIRDALISDSSYAFKSLGAQSLKGVPGTWPLWRVDPL